MRDGYPTLGDVAAADLEQLIRWNRFLGSPSTPEAREVLTRIRDRLHSAPGTEYVAASKRVGWGE